MALGAVKSHSCLVHISVTFITCGFGFRKNQGRMAIPALHLSMLTDQGESGGVVIKRITVFVKLPSFGTMAGFTVDFKAFPVRLVSLLINHPEGD